MNETPSNPDQQPLRGLAKISRRLWFALACVATLLALAYAEENWRGRHAWQAHRRASEAKGESFSLAAIIPPPVPDEKNLAMAPLLKPVLDLEHGPAGVVWHDTNGWARLQRFTAVLPPNRGTNAQLDLGGLERGTFADLKAWRDFYRGNTNYPAAAADASPAETVLTALSKFDAELQELREAAATRPDSRFPVQYLEQPPSGILLPHLYRVKMMAIALRVRATAELEAGRAAAAFEDLKLGLRVSQSIREEPIILSHLVRMAALESGMQVVREGLLRRAWTDAQLADLQARLAAVNLLAEYKAAMRGEQAGGASELDYLRLHGEWGVDVTPYFGKAATTCERVFRWGPSGWAYQNMLAFSEMCQACRQAVDERERRIYPDISEAAKRALASCRGPYGLFPKLFQPELERTLMRSGQMQTFVDATRVACALERYRLTNKDLPVTLAALSPEFCDGIPNDVMDGRPLRWWRQANGAYVLYSVGWNQTDDQGTLGWNQTEDSDLLHFMKEKQVPWVDPAQGDWVWEMPAK